MKKTEQQPYVCPAIEVMEVEMGQIVCISGSNAEQFGTETPDWFNAN